MATYIGHVESVTDALCLFEACRLQLLPMARRRLSDSERSLVTSGAVFVWCEQESGVKRWTDGHNWSASRVQGSFLTYRQVDDDARLLTDGLVKRGISLLRSDGYKMHLVGYHTTRSIDSLQRPSLDERLASVRVCQHLYPSVNKQPMIQADYRKRRRPTETTRYLPYPSPSRSKSPEAWNTLSVKLPSIDQLLRGMEWTKHQHIPKRAPEDVRLVAALTRI
jgi:hypothetical protein